MIKCEKGALRYHAIYFLPSLFSHHFPFFSKTLFDIHGR